MSLATGVVLGTYEIVGSLGAGGMGEVFRAWDPNLGREVAIKILPEAFVGDAGRMERFQQETRSLAALSHPNVVQVFDAGEQDGRPYLVMELVEGETLRQRLARGPIPWRKAAELAAAIADGLVAAHAKGIIHRDLKPENLMLAVHGHVKILDFGLAKLRADPPAPSVPTRGGAGSGDSLTQVGMVMGTTRYMSPEQVQGGELDVRSDLFSLGVILWEMVTGAHPFLRATAADTMAVIVDQEPTSASRLPAQLVPILDTCLEKDPARRFQSARDLAVALGSVAVTPEVRTLWNPAMRRRAVLRRRLLGVVGGALLLAAAAGGLYAWRGRPGGGPPQTGRVPSVLALPTKVMGAPDVAFLADAVPNSLSTLLAGVEGLDTKVPPSSVEVEKANGDLAQVAGAYHTDHLVITTLTKNKNRILLNVQLADTKTWRVRWARQYEGTQATYNDLIREAAASITLALKPGQGAEGALAGPASSSEVELALGEGNYFYNRYMAFYRDQDCEASLSAYRRAFSLDPRRADTAARIAMVQESRGWLRGDFSDGGISPTSPESWAHRALDLDPRCGLAWSILGNLETHKMREDPGKAVEYAVKGACFSPRESRAHLALGAITSGPGSVELFIATGRRASELDPMNPWTHGFAALGLSWMGRAEEALPIVERALRLEPDHRFLVRNVKAYAMLRLGRLDEAERLWHSFGRPPSSEAVFWLAALRGEREKARRLAEPLLARWLGPKMRAIDLGNAVLFNVPCLVRVGLEDEAVRLLQLSVDRGTVPPYDWLLLDPETRKLHHHPRMAPVLTASRDGAALVVRQLAAARIRGELPTYLESPLAELRTLVDQPLPGR